MRVSMFAQLFSTKAMVIDILSGHVKAADALFAVLSDENIKTMIEQGVDETVMKKVNDYVNFVYYGAPKPFWFQPANQGG